MPARGRERSDLVDATMELRQSATRDATRNGGSTEPGVRELPSGHDAVLAASECRDCLVCGVRFVEFVMPLATTATLRTVTRRFVASANRRMTNSTNCIPGHALSRARPPGLTPSMP
jgi:hypothetical protein